MSTVLEPPILGFEHAGILMTPEEFDAHHEWDDNFRYELIHGVLVVSPPSSSGERGPNELLGYWLRYYKDSHSKGSCMNLTLHEHGVRTKDCYRRADRAIWCGFKRRPNVRRDPPTIVVEFVSEGLRDRRRDFEEKRDEYLEIGVAEYWVIDRFRRQLTVFRNKRGAAGKTIVREQEIYKTPLLPGFELPLADLLKEADLFDADEASVDDR